MAAESRVIIQRAQEQGISPAAIGQEHPERAVMKIQVPEGVAIFALVAADLPALEAVLGDLRAGAVDGSAACPLEEAVGFHEAEDGSIGRLNAQGGLLLGQHGQVIGVELVAPVRVLAVLEGQSFPEWLTEGRMLPLVRTELAPEGRHWVLLCMERGVIPAFDRGQTKGDPQTVDGVTPLLGGQGFEAGLQFARGGRGGQHRAHHAEAEAGPLFLGTWAGLRIRHRVAHSSVFGSRICDVWGSTTAPTPRHLASSAGHQRRLT